MSSLRASATIIVLRVPPRPSDARFQNHWKDYRIKGRDRLKTMTLDAGEFIRRFLLHVLPSGFHRIRHYGLFARAVRARNIERARQLLAASTPENAQTEADHETKHLRLRVDAPVAAAE